MNPENTRNIKDLIKCYNAGAKPKYIFFWGHTPPKSGEIDKTCFSQWYHAPFLVENIKYPTAEHYMMAQKAKLFKDEIAYEKIISANNPGAAKAFGREVKNFDEKIWIDHRFDIVTNANFEKFIQNPDLREFIIQTKKRVLVEASPKDTIWGIGLGESDEGIDQPVRWKGLNILGFALMAARSKLIEFSR